MEQRHYDGRIDTRALAQHLLDTWNQGQTVAQAMESEEGILVQIGYPSEGLFNRDPQSALTVALEDARDGLRVTIGEQEWYREGGQIMVGGLIGFFPFFFTWPLGGGQQAPVDAQLVAQVWNTIEAYAGNQQAATGQTHYLPVEPQAAQSNTYAQPAMTGQTTRLPAEPQAATGATTRLESLYCPFCGTTNLPGEPRCQRCGTYLQARNCAQCGVSNPATANYCMRCGSGVETGRATSA